jgi:hypothetical protein
LVSILKAERHLSLQGAIRAAGDFVKQSIEAFLTAERSLSSIVQMKQYPLPGSLPGCGSSIDDPESDPHFDDVRLYTQGLRDIMIGTVHWLYETDLYFGEKGEEVRAFGWVFLASSGG